MGVPEQESSISPLEFLGPGGEMSERIRSLDWSATPIGPPRSWSPALINTVRLVLANRFPQLLWWGPQYISIYNDAYRPILGRKHPWALGRPVRECWSEIWDILRPLIDTPFRGGPATWSDDIELQINRAGFTEETHFTIAYSPVPDDTVPGGIGGVLATVNEITEQVISRRHLSVLHDLGRAPAEAKTVEEACVLSAATLREHVKDIPFALLYVIEPSLKQARLAASCGVEGHPGLRPAVIALTGESGAACWPLGEALRSAEIEVVDQLPLRFPSLPPGPWPDPPERAAVVPIQSHLAHQSAGFLVAGLSSRLQFGDSYRHFLDLTAAQLATAISSAQSYESERKRAEGLAEIDRAKTAFFSNVSHEFRTPLTLMLGPLEQVMAGSAGELTGEAAENVAISHRHALRLLRLVNTLLDFSRIEAGRAQAQYEPLDVARLTRELASTFQSLCADAGLRLTIDCPELPPGEPVFIDREMWEKIVLNLMSNAFKFTLEGEIEVRLRGEDGNMILSVHDTGVGIPAEELPHLFERFHRVEHSRGRTHEGTGIGLALVQELVKLHGGTVSVESEMNDGTTFRVVIPRGKSHLDEGSIGPPSAAEKAAPGAFQEEALSWLPDSRKDRPEPAAPKAASKPHILWADDNADMRAYVTGLLRPHFDVEAVKNGEEALAAARARKPDLLLSDVMMPGLDGFGLLREVRADSSLSGIPVILLSARAGEAARIDGMHATADDYLVKPFGARELLARVESQLKLSQARREAADVRQTADRNAILLAAIVESSDDAIISKDLEGTILSWNQAAERLFGYTAAEAVGKSITILIPPERMDEEPQILARLRRGERVDHFETVRVRKDGVRLNISLTVSPLKDSTGRIIGASKVARDITYRVRQEQALHEANEALRQANVDLKYFTYSASHDLQEPLRMVRAYSEILQKRFSGVLGPEGNEFLRHTVEGAVRMDELLQSLRIYTRLFEIDTDEAPGADAARVLDKVLDALRPAIEESGAVIQVSKLPRVGLHEFQIEQLFLNLIGNAIRYRQGRPEIQIDAVRQDGQWLFSVQDNGIGIEPRFQEQIFEMFKRLHSHSEYPGTGMGLAICRRIVERAKGRIWVESELSKGSTFFFTIPDVPAAG